MLLKYQSAEQFYTIKEYLALEENALQKHEFVDGEIIEISSKTIPHSIIATNISGELRSILKTKKEKYYVMGSDTKIHIPAENNIRYPDALVICEKIEVLEGRNDVIINPLVIIEVLSKSTENFDRGGKFDLYRSIPSFQEYILIAQKRPHVSTYFREEKDLWRTKDTNDMEASIYIRSLDVTVELAEIYTGLEFD